LIIEDGMTPLRCRKNLFQRSHNLGLSWPSAFHTEEPKVVDDKAHKIADARPYDIKLGEHRLRLIAMARPVATEMSVQKQDTVPNGRSQLGKQNLAVSLVNRDVSSRTAPPTCMLAQFRIYLDRKHLLKKPGKPTSGDAFIRSHLNDGGGTSDPS
jgi:hypothetical protein